MDTFSPLQGRHNDRESFDHTETNEQRLQELKGMSEHRAGCKMAGCRDTIDSVLSKYGQVREEVKQNPRIGLVLSAEFDTPVQQSSPSLLDTVANTPLAQKQDGRAKDRDTSCTSAHQQSQTSSTRDLMIDYAEHLHQVTSLHDDLHCSSIHNSTMSSSNDSDRYDTDISWDDLEDTLLDIYADLDDGIFQVKVDTQLYNNAGQAVDAGAEALPVHEIKTQTLMDATCLTTSPLVQITMIDPHVAVSSDRGVTKKLTDSSNYGNDERPILGHNAAEPLDLPEHSHGNVVKWLGQVDVSKEPGTAGQQCDETATAPSFSAWLEQDRVAEYVLDAGITVGLVTVALTGHVFW